MGGARPDPAPGDVDRLRGVRVARVDPARVLGVVAVAAIVILAGSALALTVSAAHQNARLTKIQQHGTPVPVTVTGCVGISSGIAMAIEYWECRGSYSLNGGRYDEVIRGSRAHLRTGQTVTAIAVPGIRPSCQPWPPQARPTPAGHGTSPPSSWAPWRRSSPWPC